MRAPFPAAAAVFALAACARVQPLQATDPDQMTETAPNEAQAEVGGVTVRAAVGGWRGRPRNLEQRLTPVDVMVRNVSGRPIRIGPEAFTLRTPGGPRRALDQNEVMVAVGSLSASERYGRPRTGAVGGPTFPGYDTPGDPRNPRAQTTGGPVPPPAQWYPMQPLSGTLANGDSTSILLFFGTPARTLATATFEVALVDEKGEDLGTVKMPFGRD